MTTAANIEKAFKIAPAIYLLGSFEKGVTVYSQQVRAHNLLWALSRQVKPKTRHATMAVVGGGIGGLTVAACALGLFPSLRVTVFEQSSDLCPLQQGSDSRWLHPRVYRWPDYGTRAPSASLPVLNWTEGRASDVADQVLRGFSSYCERNNAHDRLSVYLSVEYLRIVASERSIEWLGKQGVREDLFFRAGLSSGQREKFDTIVLAVGFGLEKQHPQYRTPSYWRNEEIAQPDLEGATRTYIVSGFGDGALVDLCRLTIERFRQDRILDDLFGADMDNVEGALRPLYQRSLSGENIFQNLNAMKVGVLAEAAKKLRGRLRKDTRVFLHMSGSSGANTAFEAAFENKSSFLNRLLLFLLYKCGAFSPWFGSLDRLMRQYPGAQAICRYGPETDNHIRSLFLDWEKVEAGVTRLKSQQGQLIKRFWTPGSFPR